MSQDLVKVENNNLPSVLDSFSIKPAQIKLHQPTSDEVDGVDIRPGQFLNTLDNSVFKSKEIVPLNITYQRDYYLGTYQAGTVSKPVCKSFEMGPNAKPHPTLSEAPQSTTCATCKHNKWTVNAGKKVPPACKESYKLVFLDAETKLPEVFYFKGLGVQPLKKYGELLKARIIQARNTGKGDFSLPDFKATLSAAKVGTAFAPQLTNPQIHGQDISNEYREYVTRFNEMPAEVEDELDQTLEATYEEV